MRYSEVFVAGGVPRHTYNPRANRRLEERLKEVADNLCKLATVTGHTKSGKTVLVRGIFPPKHAIWVDGGTVGEEDDFWSTIIAQCELFQSTIEETSTGQASEIGAEGSAEANFWVAKGSGKISSKIGNSRSVKKVRARTVSFRVTALEGLREASLPLVIDDFHYIPRKIQGSLVRALKSLIFDGLPVVLIAIPHRRYDALKVEKEMTGRLHPIEIPLWEIDELKYIPHIGFPLLNCEIDEDTVTSLCTEAIGSPHLVQDFCRVLCRQNGITTNSDRRSIVLSRAELERVYSEVAESIGRPIFEKLARGPRQRTDRKARKLKNGEEVDIYGLILHALAHIRPGLVTIEYEKLRAAIREVAVDVPQLHEVARVLRHMASIAASDESSTPVIDFEEKEKILHITDPFFAFYLRWGDMSN